MRWLNDLSIRFKLISAILLVTLTSLVVLVIAFMIGDVQAYRENMLANAVATATTIGDYSVSDLTFGDRDAAGATLAKLKRNDNLINAYLYDAKGMLFASHHPGKAPRILASVVKSSSDFRDGLLEVFEPIYYEGRYYGAVCLQLATHQMEAEIRQHFLAMTLTTGAVLLLSYFFAGFLQRLISRPIVELTDVTRRIKEQGDYSMRLDMSGADEIGTLARQFNAMMQMVMKREVDRDRALASLGESEERVRLLLDSTAEAIYGADESGHCVFANPACLRLLGYQGVEPALEEAMRSLLLEEGYGAPGGAAEGEPAGVSSDNKLFTRRDGSTFYAEYWAYPICHGDTHKGTVITFIDISARKSAEETRRLLYRAVEQAADAVMICNQLGVIEFVNPAYEEMTGYSRDELVGKTPAVLKSGIHGADFYRDMWHALNHGDVFRDTFMNRRKGGELFYQQQTIAPLKDDSGCITQFVSTSKDISSEIETQQRLHTMAYHDALTGLPNRELFRDRLEHAIAKADRDNSLVSVIFLDLDHFKNINDTLGHPVGDRLLQQVAERIQQQVRGADTVARLGGDEFTVLLEDVEDQDCIAGRAAELMQAFSRPYQVGKHEVFVTSSIGVAVYPSDVRSIDDLFRAADTAMYRAKSDGRNNYRFFTNDMAAKVLRRVTIEKGLRHALENKEFTLHYQPRVKSDGHSANSVEALIRWNHPREGMVPPDVFIPVLEETGMITEVGNWVWKTAFDQLADWQRRGLDIKMAVNVSPRQFVSSSLVEDMLAYLEMLKLSPDRVELEITEAVLLDYSDRTAWMFQAMREAGIGIAIDDFGTGFSSLSYLKRLPIHTLKIDRSFVMDVLADPEDAAIVAAIISLAKSLYLNITAEGVETQEQFDYLAAAGCDEVQGYLVSKPLPADAATAWLLSMADTAGDAGC